MQEEFVLSQIKRSNKNLLLVNSLILLTVILIMAFSYNYYYNFFLGPFRMDSTSLVAIRDLKDQKQEYVTFRGSEIFHTGLQDIEETYEKGSNKVIGRKVTTDYLFLALNDWLLVVKAAPGSTDLFQTGVLRKMPVDLKSELVSILAQEGVSVGEFNQTVLPFMLDAQSNKAIGYIGLFTLVPLFLFSVWNLLRYGKWTSDPLEHPIYKKLEMYGIPEAVADGINEDIANTGVPITKKMMISDSWLIKQKFFGLHLVSLNDVLWIHKQATKHSVNFIPVGKSYSLAVYPKNRKVFYVGMSQKDVDASIQLIERKAPHIPCGYSDVLAYLWNKDFPGFLVELEKIKNAV